MDPCHHVDCRRGDAHWSGGADRRLLQFQQGARSTTSSSAPAPSPTEKGVVIMPPKAFSPNLNAADGVLALQSQGYIVQLNNGGGYSADRPLSACKITGVDGLRGDHPPANTTVYLTVSCPNSNN
jgi:hypothetical protein